MVFFLLNSVGSFLESGLAAMDELRNKFLRRFALTDEEKRPVIIRDTGQRRFQSSKAFMVEKVLTNKQFNREVFKHTMRKLW